MATNYPLTTYFLNFISQKLEEQNDILFKDNPNNIYKYFGISQDDNVGYIYFSPENLYYSYTTWDNFYNSLFQEIKQGDKLYPAIPTILPELDWSNDKVTITNTLNSIISNISYQDRILEKYQGFKWIDKEFIKLLDKDDNLTTTELRLRGRLLLQELLPVQQYQGGSVYDLSHVEYIKAFYESKGTIRDSEYLLKYFGYNVDLGTAGEEIINVDIDWNTFDESGLKALLHPETPQEEEIAPADIDELVENDIGYFLSKYQIDCNLYNPANLDQKTMTDVANLLAANITTDQQAQNIYQEVANNTNNTTSNTTSNTGTTTPSLTSDTNPATDTNIPQVPQTDEEYPEIPLISDLKVVTKGYPDKNFYEIFNNKVVLTQEGIDWYNAGNELPDYDIIVKELPDVSKDKRFVVDTENKIVEYWKTKIEDRAGIGAYKIVPAGDENNPYKVNIELSEDGKIYFQKTGDLPHYRIVKRSDPILETSLPTYNVTLKIRNPGDIQYYNIDQNGNITLNELGAELVNQGKELPPYEIYIIDNETGLEKDLEETPIQAIQVNDSVKLRVTKAKEIVQGQAKEGDLVAIAQAYDEDGDDIKLSVKSAYPNVSYTTDKNGNVKDIEFYQIDEKGYITLTKEGADAVNNGYNLPNFIVYSTDGKQDEDTTFYAEYSPTALDLDVDVEKYQTKEEEAKANTLVGKVLIKQHGFATKTILSDGKSFTDTQTYLQEASNLDNVSTSSSSTTTSSTDTGATSSTSPTSSTTTTGTTDTGTTDTTTGTSSSTDTTTTSSNTIDGNALFNEGDGTSQVNNKIIDLNFDIDVLSPTFKGLFTADIENLVQQVLSQRNTANVTIGNINVNEPVKESYPYIIEELLIRLLKFLETYDYKQEENLTYQKNILDCRRVFSRFERLVDNLCYYRVSNKANNKVNNDLNGYEDLTLYEEFLFTDEDKFEKEDNLRKEFKKLHFDTYEVYRFVNNRIKKSVSNVNPIIITNMSLLDDRNYLYEVKKSYVDKCSPYYIKVNNKVYEKVDNQHYCKVKNRRIDDKFDVAPFLRDTFEWKDNKDGIIDKQIRKEAYTFFNTDKQTFRFDDSAVVDFMKEIAIDVYPYFVQRINNKRFDKVRNDDYYHRVINNRGIEEFIKAIRGVSEEYFDISTMDEAISQEITKVKVDFILPSKVDNRNGLRVDNRELKRVWNDERIKENQTLKQSVNNRDNLSFLHIFVDNRSDKKVDNRNFKKVDNKPLKIDRVRISSYVFDDEINFNEEDIIKITLNDVEKFKDFFDKKVDERAYNKEYVFTFIDHIFNSRVNNLNYQLVDNKNPSEIVDVIEKELINLFKYFEDLYEYNINERLNFVDKRDLREDYFEEFVDNRNFNLVSNKSNKKVKNNLRPVNDNEVLNINKEVIEHLFDRKISNDNYTFVDNKAKRVVSNKPLRDIAVITEQFIQDDEYKYGEEETFDKAFTKYNNDVYHRYQWKYMVGGKAKMVVDNQNYIKVNNLNVKSEVDINNHVHIKREDGKEFDWYYSQINEENYDWYIYYDVNTESENDTNAGSAS